MLLKSSYADGWVGIISLALSLRFAVGSLMKKLKARQKGANSAPLMKLVPVANAPCDGCNGSTMVRAELRRTEEKTTSCD